VAIDYGEVGIDKYATVEAGDGSLQSKRLDQHAHATWWAAAVMVKIMRRGSVPGRCLRRLGQHVVLGDRMPSTSTSRRRISRCPLTASAPMEGHRPPRPFSVARQQLVGRPWPSLPDA